MKPFHANENGCWVWDSHWRGKGYGILSCNNKLYYVHRLSYRLFHGEIPQGMHVCHKCDTPKCFNPDHLFLGTPKDNIMDMVTKGRHVSVVKLTNEQVQMLRSDRESGNSVRVLCETYGISRAHCQRIINRERRKGIES